MSERPPTVNGKRFLVIVAAIGLVFVSAAWAIRTAYKTESKRVVCEQRLYALGHAAQVYRERYGTWPPGTGAEFWRNAVRGTTEPHMVHETLFECPESGKPYRGPAAPPGPDPNAWLGCCEPGSHGPGAIGVDALTRITNGGADDPRLGTLR